MIMIRRTAKRITIIKLIWNKILIPFAIIHVRIIQYQYKRITISDIHNKSNNRIAKLRLLLAQEYYYKTQFQAWGKFHPDFGFSDNEYKKHRKFINWLFPLKDYDEWDIVIWHYPDAITYYQNKIFQLSNGKIPAYHIEIKKQMRKWNKEND